MPINNRILHVPFHGRPMVAPTANLNYLPFLAIVYNDFRKVEDRRMDLRLSFQFVEKHDLKLYQLHYFRFLRRVGPMCPTAGRYHFFS